RRRSTLTVSYSSDSTITNTSTLSLHDALPILGGANWLNNGSITATGATVNLGGSFTTAALGTFNATGATVNLFGVLNNSGTTLTLPKGTRLWSCHVATSNAGSFASSGGSTLAL